MAFRPPIDRSFLEERSGVEPPPLARLPVFEAGPKPPWVYAPDAEDHRGIEPQPLARSARVPSGSRTTRDYDPWRRARESNSYRSLGTSGVQSRLSAIDGALHVLWIRDLQRNVRNVKERFARQHQVTKPGTIAQVPSERWIFIEKLDHRMSSGLYGPSLYITST